MNNDNKYVLYTLRSTAFVAVFIVLVLASYGQNAFVAPFLSGVLLGAVLLWGLDKFVRGVFSPEKVKAGRREGRDGRWALVGFALVKYPLVALLIWFVVRAWGHDRRIMAFAGGFILLQVVIALRAAGKAVTTTKRDR